MLRVLILDDDALFTRTLGRVLERDSLGCRVTGVYDEAGAVAAVQAAERPFDVFLIDQRLGAGGDGIEVLAELLRASPSSQAIVFTELGNTESGLRAYRAGAFRYLHKPFKNEELVLVLRSLLALRQVQHERDWLRIHANIAEASQQPQSLREMGQMMVESAQRLAFQRARLWLLEADGSTLGGANQVGCAGLERFSECRMGLDESPYVAATLAGREPCIFDGHKLSPSYLYKRYSGDGYQPADGEWVGLPLWSGERLLGVLMLDNDTQPRRITAEDTRQLALFGKLVAAALERAQLYEKERQKRKEMELLATIGRHISERAAVVSIDELLAEVPRLIGQIIDASNLYIALHNDRTEMIELPIEYTDGELCPPRSYPFGPGLTSYVLRRNLPLLLRSQAEIAEFRLREHIRRKLKGPPARSWLGVPLAIESRAIGALVVQSVTQDGAFTEDHKLLLSAVAGQIAGAIQTARLREAEHASTGRLSALQRVSEELLKWALLEEDRMWHAVLTAATAEYALRFNRAMLFLLDDSGAALAGKRGVGHLDSREARASWRRDVKRGLTLPAYLGQLSRGDSPTTPVDAAVRAMRVDLRGSGHVFAEVIESGQRAVVRAQRAAELMPADFVATFGAYEYAVLPVTADERPIGLLVVDNAFNAVPVRVMAINELEQLLRQAALVYSSLVQRRASLSLLELSKQILARVAERPLQQTLSQICEVACVLTGAASATIVAHPRDQAEPLDRSKVGAAGLQRPPEEARCDPAWFPLLREGHAVIVDGGQLAGLDAATREFLEGEGVRTLLAAPVYDPDSGQLSGVLQLHYRSPKRFDDEPARANALAELAGAAIQGAEAHHRAKQGELLVQTELLKRALALTPESPSAERELALATIAAVGRLLGPTETRVGVLMRDWREPSGARPPQELRRQYFLVDGRLYSSVEEQLDRGLTGEVFASGRTLYADDVQKPPYKGHFVAEYMPQQHTRSELDVPIVLDGHVLGVINVEAPQRAAFSADQVSAIERLAATAALALGNLRRQQNLRRVMSAAQEVVAPSDLDATLAALIDAARQVAPGVAALTLWYRHPVSGLIMLYPRHFGVLHPDRLYAGPVGPDSIVTTLMERGEAAFAIDVEAVDMLGGEFVNVEQIRSVAALPLVAGNETIGALFFNYRERHDFTSEEKTLFQTMAAFAAASVRDARRLEALRAERERLEQERRRLDVATRITEAVGTILDLDQTLVKIMGTLGDLFPEVQICLMTYDAEERSLSFAPASLQFYTFQNISATTRLDVFSSRALVCSVARTTLESRRPELLNIPRALTHPEYLRANEETRSELCMSLVSADHGDLLGVLVLESAQEAAFTPDDDDLVRAAAQSIGIAIERARQSSNLRFKAAVAEATVWTYEFRHNFNKALSIIRGQTYLLRSAVPPESLPQLGHIRAQVAQLEAYANPLRMDRKVMALDDWIADQLAGFTTSPGVTRRFSPGCPGALVEAVPLLLERVLRHLLRNAKEAMCGEGVLTITTGAPNGRARVTIHNTGPDLDPVVVRELWVRPVTTKSEQRQGVEGGLGLLFVRSAVELMGGAVGYQRHGPGEGVSFYFSLPIAAGGASA